MSIYSGDEDFGDEITSGEPYPWPRYSPLVLDLEEPEGECCPMCAEPLRITGYCGACEWRAIR